MEEFNRYIWQQVDEDGFDIEVSIENWHDKFEEEYGYFPDEDDYRITRDIKRFKRLHGIK